MISITIPVFNERESLRPLMNEIVEVFEEIDRDYEVVFIDDGSFDGSSAELESLAVKYPQVRVVTLLRNSGKSIAYTAGFAECRGDIVVTMDADLQDVPSELPKLLEKIGEGFDLVVGWKQSRVANEPHKALPSKVFNGLLVWMFGIRLHDSNCGYRAMRRHLALNLELRGDLYRFIPQMAHLKGAEVCEVPVEHRKREFGKSKYGPTRFWTGLLDVLTLRFVSSYFERPLHFFGTIGLLPLLVGTGLEIYVLVMKILGDLFREHVAAIIIGVLLMLAGIQCILTGLVGEMIQYSRGSEALTKHRGGTFSQTSEVPVAPASSQGESP